MTVLKYARPLPEYWPATPIMMTWADLQRALRVLTRQRSTGVSPVWALYSLSLIRVQYV
jgi:hypothetical protein